MSVRSTNVHELHRVIACGSPVDLIDVRTPVEFEEVHVACAWSVPLDRLDVKAVLSQRKAPANQPLYVICKGGTRGAKACEKFLAAGFDNAINVEGGTSAWIQAGLPVVRGQKSMSLERQVRVAAGSLVLLGAVLGWLFHPAFFGLSAFVGAGLVFAGITDFCGMGLLIARMPWNQRSGSVSCSCETKA